MDFKFLIYCFLTVVAITGGAFYFYSARQEVIAAIYFVGTIVAAIFFGFRWFSSSGELTSAAKGPWPPTINYCPDLLTLATVNGVQACIDTVGVSQSGGLSTSDGTQIGDQYVFNLFLNQTGNARIKSLCDQANSKQVTWEGVWNGSICMNVEPPLPPSTSS
jgi:hypothetical protein